MKKGLSVVLSIGAGVGALVCLFGCLYGFNSKVNTWVNDEAGKTKTSQTTSGDKTSSGADSTSQADSTSKTDSTPTTDYGDYGASKVHVVKTIDDFAHISGKIVYDPKALVITTETTHVEFTVTFHLYVDGVENMLDPFSAYVSFKAPSGEYQHYVKSSSINADTVHWSRTLQNAVTSGVVYTVKVDLSDTADWNGTFECSMMWPDARRYYIAQSIVPITAPVAATTPTSSASAQAMGISPSKVVLNAATPTTAIVPTLTPDNATCPYVYFTSSDESKIAIDYEYCQSGKAYTDFTKVAAFDGNVTLTAHSCTNPEITADCLVSCAA
jgi:hypothetical protein